MGDRYDNVYNGRNKTGSDERPSKIGNPNGKNTSRGLRIKQEKANREHQHVDTPPKKTQKNKKIK